MFGFFYFNNIFIIKFIFILFFSFIGALLEVFSLALLPLMFMILKDYNYFLTIISKISFNFLEYQSQSVIFFFCLFTLLTFIIKAVVISFFNFLNIRFCEKIKIDLVKLIFNRYININYLQLKQEQNSNLQNNIFFESEQLKLFISETLLVIREVLVIFFFILFFYLFTKNLMIFCILFLFLPNAVQLLFSGDKIKKYIDNIHISQPSFVKSVNEGINSIKESRVYNVTNIFLAQIEKNIKKIEYNSRWLNLLQINLKIFLELIVVFILVFSILFTEFSQLNSKENLLNLSILFVSIYRLYPSINVFNSLIIKLSLRKKSFNNLKIFLNYKSFKNKSFKKTSIVNFTNKSFFKIQDCSFKYQDRNNFVLSNVNFKQKIPLSLGILGPSGSGKSTLLELIMGLIKPVRGGVYFNNKNVQSLGYNWLRHISYASQKPLLLDDTIKNNIIFGDNNFDDYLFKKVIEISELKEFIQKLPDKEFTFIGEGGKFVSGGQAQRIAIARALYKNRPILILDEATNSIDFKTERNIIKNIKKLKKKIFIFTTHNLKSYGKSNFCIKLKI
jgi:ABC-type multidrug transport system fused ATPase/permease subunit